MSENMSEHNEDTNEGAVKLLDSERKRAIIRDIGDRIDAFNAERTSINESISACYSECEAEGIPRKAMKAALKRREMAEDQRNAYDPAYELCLRAFDIGYQPQLFTEDEFNPEPEEATEQKPAARRRHLAAAT